MARLLALFVLLVFTLESRNIQAQGRRGMTWNRGGGYSHGTPWRGDANRYRGYPSYRSATPFTLFGFSFGTAPYGYDFAGYPDPYFLYPYSYDPWLRGSFREPDLLDDPYFYDRAAAVRRYREPLVIRQEAAPVPSRSVAPRWEVAKPSIPTQQPDQLEQASQFERLDALQSANEKLLLNLAKYDGGDAWMEYLGTNRVISLVIDNKTAELRELLARFDGVAQNRELQIVAQIEGFAETRSQVRGFLLQPFSAPPAEAEQESFETLPAPQPESILDSARSL